MFLRNYWYVAAMPSELDGDELLGRWILNEPVLPPTAGSPRYAISVPTGPPDYRPANGREIPSDACITDWNSARTAGACAFPARMAYRPAD